MMTTMLGTDVAKSMKDLLIHEVEELKKDNIIPNLIIIRVGARPDDLAYERGAKKRMELLGIVCNVVELDEQIQQEEFECAFDQINQDDNVHGILLFQPLPAHLDLNPIKERINPLKDVDCMCNDNVAKVFLGDKTGHAPCTAEAVMEMLDYYKIPLSGKNVVIIGRSVVIGRPLSMLMLAENATITVCHSKSKDMEQICREADVLVAAVGKARMVKESMVKDGAVIVDVGINVDEAGNLCGDVDFECLQDKTSYISPVPRGVGSVTTSVLAKHVISAARQLNQ